MPEKSVTTHLALVHNVPPRIRLVTIVFVTNLLIFLFLRLGFLFAFIPDTTHLFSLSILKALYLGFKFDARLATLICLPILLFSGIPILHLFKKNFARRFWTVYLLLTFAVILLIYLFDFGIYAYVKTRLNASLLMFTNNPGISLKMIWQTYAVIRILILFFLINVFYFWWIKKRLAKSGNVQSILNQTRGKKIVKYTVFGFLMAAVCYGKLARYPLRWSEAFFSPNTFISYLGVNPVLFFYDTFSATSLNYDLDKVKQYYPLLAGYYGIEGSERTKLSLERSCSPLPRLKGTPNIVFIIMETFAGFKTGVVNDGLDSSPNFDKLSGQGIYFINHFVPMENTSRSLFALIAGMPDASRGRYSSWNPLLVDQQTVMNYFSNYKKMYFLGGSANWGNIRGLLSHNIKDLEIFEEGSYRSPVLDVWGISDADLFMEANNILRERNDTPFFAFIQTSGNHRPFLVPPDSRGFNTVSVSKKILEKNGFYSLEEYNGFRFLDHCLGYYFDLAQREAYFNNTIFVIMGDHGTLNGARDTRFGDLSLGSFRVPLLIYAPGIIKEPGKISTVISELDVLPTLAGLIGKPYVNTTLGRDVFDPAYKDRMYAFTYTPFRMVPRVGLIDEEFYINVEPDGSYGLYRWASANAPRDVKAQYPEKAKQMADTALAIMEYSRYLLYHNKK
ncbi:MAG TPA: LTA synthase family protein [Candidatus Kapabacteria bacterium]|nr:LTA synthase family protein [Candidatus Kapabacteria bacterium]